MKISLNWLSTHLDLSEKSIDEIENLLTFAGIEVEQISHTGIPSEKIVVAEVKEATQHPNADRLQVTKVDAGEGELRQIVCGAKNFKVGDRVPCCLPGADLGGGFVIGEAKMRGVESRGMLAAASEIGLTDAEDGLLILPADTPIGKPLQELFPADTILELEVTPNRPDLLSHYGLARELAVLLKTPVLTPSFAAPETASTDDAIRLDSNTACPWYTLTGITNAKVKESPAWLKERLEAIGLRPINNVVDVTNYVLFELGQPLHAFDAAKVTTPIHVRNAKEGEEFLALDEESYHLKEEDTVISDAAGKALALGGIMGGLDSGVTESTTDILLEAAWFTPASIRRTARRLELSSDSSYRFERGVDTNLSLPAVTLAVKLLLELTGGTAVGSTLTNGKTPKLTGIVSLEPEKLAQITDNTISPEEASDTLSRLGLVNEKENDWRVPSYRADLQRHIDLVEEVVRIHGFNSIPSRFQANFVPTTKADRDYDADMRLRQKLAALGFYECQTIKLIAESQLQDVLPLRPLKEGDLIRVARPLSEDHVILRASLAPGLVASATRNLRQGAARICLFELGAFFRNAGGGKAKDLESQALGILLSGRRYPTSWANPEAASDLYDLKAVIHALVPTGKLQFAPREQENYALGADIRVDGQTIGSFGMLRPARQREIDSTAPLFLAELDLERLRALSAISTEVKPLPQFPGSTRDTSIEAPLSLPNIEIEKVLEKLNSPLLTAFECTALFRDPEGKKLAADRKAITYHLYYRSADKTLTGQEIDEAHHAVLAHLKKSLPIEFR